MKIFLLLVPITLLLVGVGVLLFSWAVRNGQYDDLDGPAHRILYDDDDDMIPDEARQDSAVKAEENADTEALAETNTSRDSHSEKSG